MKNNEEKLIENRKQDLSLTPLSKSNTKPDFYLDDNLLNELREFCEDFNPYEEMDIATKLRLKAYGIKALDNPFEITNALLLLLENNLQYRIKQKESNDH